jgi:hypothetical protein
VKSLNVTAATAGSGGNDGSEGENGSSRKREFHHATGDFLFLDPPEMDQRMSRGLRRANKLDNTWTEHFHIPRVDTSLHSREQQKPHTRRVYFHIFTLTVFSLISSASS